MVDTIMADTTKNPQSLWKLCGFFVVSAMTGRYNHGRHHEDPTEIPEGYTYGRNPAKDAKLLLDLANSKRTLGAFRCGMHTMSHQTHGHLKSKKRSYVMHVPMRICVGGHGWTEKHPILFFLPGTTPATTELTEQARAQAMSSHFIYVEPIPWHGGWNAEGSGCCGAEKWGNDAE